MYQKCLGFKVTWMSVSRSVTTLTNVSDFNLKSSAITKKGTCYSELNLRQPGQEDCLNGQPYSIYDHMIDYSLHVMYARSLFHMHLSSYDNCIFVILMYFICVCSV